MEIKPITISVRGKVETYSPEFYLEYCRDCEETPTQEDFLGFIREDCICDDDEFKILG